MYKIVLKAKFYVTGILDTAPCWLDTAPCSDASNENLQKLNTGACWLGTTPCLVKICRKHKQTAGLGGGHGGVSAGHDPVWTVCKAEKQVSFFGFPVLALVVLMFSTLSLVCTCSINKHHTKQYQTS